MGIWFILGLGGKGVMGKKGRHNVKKPKKQKAGGKG